MPSLLPSLGRCAAHARGTVKTLLVLAAATRGQARGWSACSAASRPPVLLSGASAQQHQTQLRPLSTYLKYLEAAGARDDGEVGGEASRAPVIAFPGGGIFYWWQAGAVAALQEHYDLGSVDMVGASAGALAATLGATGVDMEQSLDLALHLCDENGVWERGGLGGVWGGMVRDWLDALLPPDAADRCRGRVHLLTLRVLPPLPRRHLVTDFSDRRDLVGACMASVHIPWFMDGRFSARFRGGRYVDGSYRAGRRACGLGLDRPTLFLDWRLDPAMRGKGKEFLRLHDRPALEAMMQGGYNHVECLRRSGELDFLEGARAAAQRA